MRKLFFLFFIAVVFNTYSQNIINSTTIITLGNVNIKIPAPGKQFIEAGDYQREYFSAFEPNTIKLYCVFLDTSDYRKIVKQKNDTVSPNKYLLVESIKKYAGINCSEIDFADIRKGVTESLPRDIKHITDSVHWILSKPTDIISEVDLEHPKTIGCIYDLKDACGIVQMSVFKYKYSSRKMLRTINYILIKGKIVMLYVNYSYNGDESIKLISKVSESWAKAILNANK